MARLPTPGSDGGVWGGILNDFLLSAHNDDGTLKPQAITAAGGATDDTVVHNSGAEDVAGTKTFVASPVVPEPTSPSHAATKNYVDTTVSAGASDATTSSKGIVQLAGDLGGTAANPTVPALTGKADDTAVVHKSGSETITGSKNFTGGLSSGGTAVVVTNDARLTDQRVPVDGTVTTAKLVTGAVTSNEIFNGTIVDGDISGSAAIAQSKIANLTSDLAGKASTADLAGKADDTAVVHKAGSETVTGAKNFTGGLSAGGAAVIVEGDTRLTNQRVPTDGSVTTAKLTTGAVTTNEIANGTILDADVSASAAIAQSKVAGLVSDLAGKASASDLANKQDLDADLTAIAGLAPTNDDVLQRKSGAWTNRTPTQLKTDLVLTKSDVGLGNVDNTSDASKPISTATQSALDDKAGVAARGCRVYTSIDVGVNTGGAGTIAIPFDSERFDTDGFHSTLSLNTRITVPAGLGGIYTASGCVRLTAGGSASERSVFIRKSGTDIIAWNYISTNALVITTISTIVQLVDGDYLELWVTQSSGGTLTIQSFNGYTPEFGVVRIGS